MPDLTLSSAMDAFLAEEDPANVFLPLAGGTMDEDAIITFDNGSRLKEGTTNAGANGGIAQVCSIDYELKWEAGKLYVMQQDGFTIRVEMFGFTAVPTTTDDDTKGYIVGSRRILDDGTIYVCTDATEDTAVWAYQGLLDIAGFASINQDARQLIADDGSTVMLDWSYRTLNDASGNPVAKWGEDFGTGNQGIAFGPDGMGSFYHLLSSQGINFAGGSWYDGSIIGYSSATAIDLANRQLIGTDGTTVMAQWSNSSYFETNQIYGIGGSRGIDFYNGALVDGYTNVLDWGACTLDDQSGNLSANWAQRFLYDGASTTSFDWASRKLYASDGTTVAADWSTGTPAFAQGASYTPTAYASLPATPAEGTVCYVNDADSPYSLGSVVTSGGTDKILACFDGTDWRIIAHFP